MYQGRVTVHVTSNFARSFKNLPPHLQTLAIEKDQLFQNNPFHPQLHTHKLKGRLQGFWSYSVNYAHRVLFRFINNHKVLYYDVGSHDIYR